MMNLVSIAAAAALLVSLWAGPARSADSPPDWLEPGFVPPAVEASAEEPEAGADSSFTIGLSFAGDCMLATSKGQCPKGSFNWYAANQEPSYFLEKVCGIFAADDFTIVNLENVLTDRPLAEAEKSTDPAYWFRGPTSNVDILTAGGVEAVSLANNHTGDYGPQGRRDTIAAVEAAGLLYGTNDHTFYLEKNGFTIAVICHGLWVEGQAAQICKRIEAASQASDYQIVLYHGGKESVHVPEDWKVRASHRLVDAGADLVIGNHPHVLQPTEVYQGVHILYSLGNFCYGGHRRPENRTVIYQMRLTIDQGAVVSEEVTLVPCYVYTGDTNNWQPAPITDETEKQQVLDFLSGRRKLPY
ncbi:MAG: CapA family protein [Oscillospiraceae bacterium]|nr:CapA family protein [Oscillospiraceae bacterium]